MKGEVWKACKGHEGYDVSDAGRVRSWKRYKTREEPQVLRPSNSNGYPYVNIGGGPRRIHELVARAFIGPKPEGMIIMHIDGHKDNNAADNLCYNTRSKAAQSLAALGCYGPARLSPDEVVRIREQYAAGASVQWLAHDTGRSTNAVRHAISGKTYKLLGGPLGLRPPGFLSDEQVRRIRHERNIRKRTLSDIAREFSVDDSHISYLARGLRRSAAGGALPEVNKPSKGIRSWARNLAGRVTATSAR